MRPKKALYLSELERLKNDQTVVGVLLVGKGATATEETFEALNDIDLIVLTSTGAKNRRIVKKIDGVDIDMSYLPVQFVETVLNEKILLWIEILASGKIVYSQDIDSLIETSKRIWQKGPDPLSDLKKDYWSFYLTNGLEDIRNRLNDDAMAKYLMVDWLSSMMGVMFKVHQQFIPLKKKRWIGQIKALDVVVGILVEDVLLTSDTMKQFELIEVLFKKITDALGGPIHSWSHEEFPEE